MKKELKQAGRKRRDEGEEREIEFMSLVKVRSGKIQLREGSGKLQGKRRNGMAERNMEVEGERQRERANRGGGGME